MAFTQITNTELNSRGATTLPNQPKISATALKQEFDAPAKEIVAPAVNRLITELEATTASASIGMVAPLGRSGETAQAVVDKISLDLAYLEGSFGDVAEKAHTHENKEILDKFTEDNGDLYYDEGKVYTGDIDYSESVNKPSINNVELNGNKTLTDLGIATYLSELEDDTDHRTVSDTDISSWNAKAEVSDIPTALEDLTDDSTHRLVTDTEKSSWDDKSKVSFTQIRDTGEKIATITIDSVSTDIYASNGGGSGAVDSVNNMTGDVVLDYTDVGALPDTTVLADLTDDSTHRLVTDTEKTTWSAKADTSDIPTDLADLTDDSTHRLVTDTEKTSWNAKADSTDIKDATLTIQKNGTTVQTFTANQSTNATANITTDDWVATGTVSSGAVTFSGIDDTSSYGYTPYFNITTSSTNKNPTAQISTLTGTGTASMSVTYTTDADNGTSVKLRRLK